MRRLLLLLSFLLMSFNRAEATLWISEPPIKIGVLKTEHLDETTAAQAILLDKLRKEFQPRVVSLAYYDWNGLEKAIKGKSVDLILVNSPFFSTIEHEKNIKPLVGLIRKDAIDADHMLAGTLVTGNQNIPPRLSSLRGKDLYLASAANESNIVFRNFLLSKEVNENKFFSKVHEINGGTNELLDAIEKHPDAAALLPACALEDEKEFRKNIVSKLRVIDEKFGDGLNCKRTTSLYPGWVLASVSQDDMNMVHKATAAALTTVMADSLQWGFPPSNFDSIRNVLIDLRYGPYEKTDPLRIKEFIYANRYWALGILLTVLLIAVHSVIVSVQVRRKTRSIETLMEEKILFSKEITAAKERIQAMEKFQSLNQLSSLLAHELKQPLGAIRNYSRGLMKRADKNTVDNKVLCSTLAVIVSQSDRAASIVEHVRKYAKNVSIEREILDVNRVVADTVRTFRNSYAYSGKVLFKPIQKELSAEINVLEVELALINLLKNSSEALAGLPNPEIIVSTSQSEGNAVISVKDNGRLYSQEEVQNFFQPLFTTKENGMGLGLTIVTHIVEEHGGRLNTFANPNGGVTFQLIFPLMNNLS